MVFASSLPTTAVMPPHERIHHHINQLRWHVALEETHGHIVDILKVAVERVVAHAYPLRYQLHRYCRVGLFLKQLSKHLAHAPNSASLPLAAFGIVGAVALIAAALLSKRAEAGKKYTEANS